MWDELVTQLIVLTPLVGVIVYFAQRAIARQTAQTEAILQRVRTDGTLEIDHLKQAIHFITTTSSVESLGQHVPVSFDKSLEAPSEMAKIKEQIEELLRIVKKLELTKA